TNHIQIFIRVPEVDLSPLRDRHSIVRIALREAVDLKHLPAKFGGHAHAGEIAGTRCLLQARNVQASKGGARSTAPVFSERSDCATHAVASKPSIATRTACFIDKAARSSCLPTQHTYPIRSVGAGGLRWPTPPV